VAAGLWREQPCRGVDGGQRESNQGCRGDQAGETWAAWWAGRTVCATSGWRSQPDLGKNDNRSRLRWQRPGLLSFEQLGAGLRELELVSRRRLLSPSPLFGLPLLLRHPRRLPVLRPIHGPSLCWSSFVSLSSLSRRDGPVPGAFRCSFNPGGPLAASRMAGDSVRVAARKRADSVVVHMVDSESCERRF